ncbi:MAG: penicillin-binding protein, partial [Burkholderiaceae bacterium]|nr:penicillin-binding protein [Burkholderiaceae bacterium]
RMFESGRLNEAQFQASIREELRYAASNDDALQAPFVAEMARMLAYELFRDDVYTAGLKVYTTIVADDQRAANAAVRAGVLEYDRKYGYRGPEAFIDLSGDSARADDQIDRAISDAIDVDDFLPAVVLDASPSAVTVTRGHRAVQEISGDGLKFVSHALGPRTTAARQIRRGAVVRITQAKPGQWEITQLPEVEAALVSANVADGSIRALVGGFDFSRRKFNRVTQAWRQPGSAFKPFVYSAALEKGLMTSTLINDAPIVIDPALTGGQLWDPKNYDGKFEGPMTMRQAIAKSKNMVSIRIVQSIGPRYAQDYVTRFGFDAEKHPPFLTMALGAGYRVDPHIVTRITDSEGRVLAQVRPAHAGDDALRTIDERNAFIMHSLLREVVRSGTAARANSLKRNDLAGKTGTTNDAHDAWFAGYQPSIAAVAWVGFDQPRKLGDRETGGGLALPIWMSYMGKALRNVPERAPRVPAGVAQIEGEWYYAETRPGDGVASLGMVEEPPATSIRPATGELPFPSFGR